jgi:hypothetical protein
MFAITGQVTGSILRNRLLLIWIAAVGRVIALTKAERIVPAFAQMLEVTDPALAAQITADPSVAARAEASNSVGTTHVA